MESIGATIAGQFLEDSRERQLPKGIGVNGCADVQQAAERLVCIMLMIVRKSCIPLATHYHNAGRERHIRVPRGKLFHICCKATEHTIRLVVCIIARKALMLEEPLADTGHLGQYVQQCIHVAGLA